MCSTAVLQLLPFAEVETSFNEKFLTLSVYRSEIINAGPLPENPFLWHQPHDSFDGNGFLKPEALAAADQTVIAQPTTFFSQPPPPIQQLQRVPQLQHLQQLPPPSVPPPDLAFEQGLQAVASEVLAEAVLDGCRDVAEQVTRETEAAAEIAQVRIHCLNLGEQSRSLLVLLALLCFHF